MHAYSFDPRPSDPGKFYSTAHIPRNTIYSIDSAQKQAPFGTIRLGEAIIIRDFRADFGIDRWLTHWPPTGRFGTRRTRGTLTTVFTKTVPSAPIGTSRHIALFILRPCILHSRVHPVGLV